MNRHTQRRQLEEEFSAIRKSMDFTVPPRGWLHAIRSALGIPLAVLAARGGKTAEAVRTTETREAEGTITLASLRSAANDLGCDLLYAIVPRRPLEETLHAAAERAAESMMAGAAQTMSLEDQTVPSSLAEHSRSELIQELERKPRLLWRWAR